jgi:cation diffusion facilitator family transporter
MTLAVAQIISRPADEGHPWGHGRAETVATAILSFLLLFAGAQLILNAGADLVSGASREAPEPLALMATVVSILGKILLAWTQRFLGKKADSPMLRANAKNMAGDVVISAGVLAGLFLSTLTGAGLFDSAAAFLVGLWVIKAAVGIFFEANAELMDGGSGKEFYRAVFEAVHSVPGARNPHRARMRRIAGFWDIDIDIEVEPSLTIREAHAIAAQVERAIKGRVEGVYDIMVHVEPAGNREQESFGLKETQALE